MDDTTAMLWVLLNTQLHARAETLLVLADDGTLDEEEWATSLAKARATAAGEVLAVLDQLRIAMGDKAILRDAELRLAEWGAAEPDMDQVQPSGLIIDLLAPPKG